MSTDLPGLYLLGSLNRHITVHSQQRRAVNLIHALIETHATLDGKSIAVVGAGFAGLTAAAFALEKTTAEVSLFDEAPRPLWIQDNCANRWIHPGIYDWPLPGSLEPLTSLPLLNWRAGTARDVAIQVRREWERRAATEGRLHVRLESRITGATASNDNRLLLLFPDGQQEPFDLVILAVGFGLEAGSIGQVGYWNDADGLEAIAPGSSILVCGFGDGGLADVLRLCLPTIRQESLIELVRHVPAATRLRLVEWEERFRGNSASLDRMYQNLRVEPVIRILADASPPPIRVALIGTGNLYSTRSAILNRFLVSQLRQARSDEAFELIIGPVDRSSLTVLPGGKHRIKIGTDKKERDFDKVVLRLGPAAVYNSIAPLSAWSIGKERQKHWYDLPQSLDRTRVPFWDVDSMHDESSLQDFLAYESSSRRWCLAVHSEKCSVNWRIHVKLALENVQSDHGDLNVRPLSLTFEQAIVDEAAIARAVRALCAADVLVADVTDFDPCVLFLLGIRAVVRRGVTIACTQRKLSPKFLKGLPFNLKELNLVSLFDEKLGQNDLAAALAAGLSQSATSDRYLDLPVYDYVRTEPADTLTADASRILFLRRFEGYGVDRELHVTERIKRALNLPAARVEALIDQTTPRLAGQRLYEAIRHWKTCVVDLTWWRPNVLFELGVRLAVQGRGTARGIGTYCILDESQETGRAFANSRKNFRKLLCPFIYDLETSSFQNAFDEAIPGHVYQAAFRHFRTKQDHFDQRVDTLLVAAAAMTSNDDPLQAVDIKPLYARDNQAYGDEVRQSGFERLCAAWSCLADQHQPEAMRPLDLLDPQRAIVFRRFYALGSRLKSRLAHRYEAYERRLKARIEDAEHKARESGAAEFADLLDRWQLSRQSSLWKLDFAALHENDRRDSIKDCEDLHKALVALERRLAALQNPVLALPLQGVRLDREDLEHTLRKLRNKHD